MKAIVSVSQDGGASYPDVGMNHRSIVAHLKTERGVRNWAKRFAKGKRHRIEFFHDERIYGEPFKTILVHTVEN